MLAVLYCTVEIQAETKNKFLIVLCWLLTGRRKARTLSIPYLFNFGLLSSRFNSFYGDQKRNFLLISMFFEYLKVLSIVYL